MSPLASQQTRVALSIVQQRPAYDGGQLMSDRRTFLQGAVALTLVAAVPTLPMPLDAWDLFLSRVRARLIKLTRDGYQITNLEISPEHDGHRLVQVWVSHEYSIVQSVVWKQRV
jgi:hypothetical protein